MKDLRCAYDVSRLTTLTAQLKDASDARVYAERHNEQSREDMEMYSVCMARCAQEIEKIYQQQLTS